MICIESMRQAFGSSLYDIWGIRLLGVEGRGQTRVVGTGALLYDDEKRYLIKERIDKLEVLLFDFAGLEKDKNEICEIEIDEKEKIYLAQGYDGHIAILSNDKQETWLTNLWQFITDHYAGVRDLERYLYAWAFSLSKEEQSPDLKDVRDALEAIPRIELSIDILTYESLPYNFAGKGYERKVYEGIYKAWDTEKAIESLNDKFNTLLEEKAQQKSNKIQYLLNILVFILACVTLISVSHDIFAFPYGNAFVKSWTPYILSLLFLFLGCIVFLYVMKESILSRKNKRK